MKRISLIMLVLYSTCALGCGGAKFSIVANEIERPVSASKSIFDKDGMLLKFPSDLELVHHFKFAERHMTIFWTSVDLKSPEHNISEKLTALLDQHDGDAIVNLKVSNNDWNWCINYWGIIPILPSVVTTYVEGDIVRILQR
jgi:hypothetical protein